jgi:hypothetical protein
MANITLPTPQEYIQIRLLVIISTILVTSKLCTADGHAYYTGEIKHHLCQSEHLPSFQRVALIGTFDTHPVAFGR